MASVIRFDKWENTLGETVLDPGTGGFKIPGSVVQVKVARSGPQRQIISSINPVLITGLEVAFTPKFADSLILVQAAINTNAVHVHSFGVFRGGQKTVETTGQTNNNEPGMQITGYPGSSGTDNLYTLPLMHHEIALNTLERTYGIYGTAGWSGTVYSLQINNRNSNDMAGFSYMTVTEIAQ